MSCKTHLFVFALSVLLAWQVPGLLFLCFIRVWRSRAAPGCFRKGCHGRGHSGSILGRFGGHFGGHFGLILEGIRARIALHDGVNEANECSWWVIDWINERIIELMSVRLTYWLRDWLNEGIREAFWDVLGVILEVILGSFWKALGHVLHCMTEWMKSMSAADEWLN